MKTIGLIGGMSWESTALCYRLINEGVRDALGGLHSAKILMASVDFAEVEPFQASGEWDRIGSILAGEAVRLEAAGADVIAVTSNTMHKVAEQIEAAISIPLLNLIDVTADAVNAANLRRVALLGTAFTMEQDFYKARLAASGLDVVVPAASDRAVIHRIIFEELVLGVFTDESRTTMSSIIARLDADGAEGVILGCTELELLVGPADSPLPIFPTAALHSRAAVDWALNS